MTDPEAVPIAADATFAIIPTWVLDADVSAQAIRLYCILRRYADATGYSFPSRARLAERLHVKDVQTVDRALKELVGLGAVVVVPRYEDGRQITSGYRLVSVPQVGRGTSATPEGHSWDKGRGTDTPRNESHSTISTTAAQPPRTQQQDKRGTRLPADWSPDPSLVDYAVAQGFTRSQVDRIGLDFRDYWTAKPGQGGIKLDWAATWRMWVRNEAERKGVKPRTQAAPTQAARDPQAARQAADAAARKRQEDQRAAWRADQARQMALLAEMDAQ